jgi:hypothetical protein
MVIGLDPIDFETLKFCVLFQTFSPNPQVAASNLSKLVEFTQVSKSVLSNAQAMHAKDMSLREQMQLVSETAILRVFISKHLEETPRSYQVVENLVTAEKTQSVLPQYPDTRNATEKRNGESKKRANKHISIPELKNRIRRDECLHRLLECEDPAF